MVTFCVYIITTRRFVHVTLAHRRCAAGLTHFVLESRHGFKTKAQLLLRWLRNAAQIEFSLSNVVNALFPSYLLYLNYGIRMVDIFMAYIFVQTVWV